MKYTITKDKYLDKYVLWENHKNYKVMLYSGYKYQCESYLKYVVGGYIEAV